MKGRAAGTIRFAIIVVAVLITVSCNQARQDNTGDVPEQRFSVRSLGKSDINMMMDIYVVEQRDQLRLLMEKLYRRNPRELKKSPYPAADENVKRLFSRTNNWFFEDLNDVHGADAIELSLERDYKGDRVFAFVAGLTSMLMSSYNNKTDFYLYDNIDPQVLYNSARNVEIAVWKLGSTRDENGELLIYSNSLPDEEPNHSYANLFGKITSLQDTMAKIVANKTNRTISRVIQRMATAVFLPVP